MVDYSLITDEPLDCCVYAHINKQTGGVYVGITNNIKRRWKSNGKQYKECPKFYEAIENYDFNDFDHIVLIEGISRSMARIFECELIKKYNLIEEGYNMDEGSWDVDVTKRSKPVYQYDRNGNFIKRWDTLLEAKKFYGRAINPKHPNQLHYGFLWSYEFKEKLSPYTPYDQTRHNPIYQYDLNGNFVKKWDDIQDAYKIYGKFLLYKNRKSSHGFQWSSVYYEKMPNIKSRTVERDKNAPRVYQFDLDGNLVCIHEKWWEIEFKGIRPEHIYDICAKYTTTQVCKKNIWVFEDEATKENITKIIEKHNTPYTPLKTMQYDIDGNLIHIYNTSKELEEAGFNVNTVNSSCYQHMGKYILYQGFQWRKSNSEPPGKFGIRGTKRVIQKTHDDVYIATYESASEATKKLGVKSYKHILSVCNGKKKTAYGYKWEFEK